MKKLALIFVLSLMSLSHLKAQRYTTIEAISYDISDNLDLEAVASVFGESRNLQDFENKLNHPRLRLSNLDLNQDGYIDYLRVLETYEYGVRLISIQALIARDLYQDVAVISVERDRRGRPIVQVVGDVYLYGPNYIIQPVYVHTPVIWVSFNRPYYQVWRSPYYWGYYPTYYHHRAPCHTYSYYNNVYVHVNINNHYYRVEDRYSSTSVHIQSRHRSNDYGRINPHKSFTKRNRGYKNRTDLNRSRNLASATTNSRERNRDVYTQRKRRNISTSSDERRNTKGNSIKTERDSRVRNNSSNVNVNRGSRDRQYVYNNSSAPQRERSGRTNMNTQSSKRQNKPEARTQYTSRPNSQSGKVQSTRGRSSASSNRAQSVKTTSPQRQSVTKHMAKSSNRKASARKSSRNTDYGRS